MDDSIALFEDLLRILRTPEFIISQLICIPARRHVLQSILNEKLLQIKQIVTEIDLERERDLAEDWKQHLIVLWHKYFPLEEDKITSGYHSQAASTEVSVVKCEPMPTFPTNHSQMAHSQSVFSAIEQLFSKLPHPLTNIELCSPLLSSSIQMLDKSDLNKDVKFQSDLLNSIVLPRLPSDITARFRNRCKHGIFAANLQDLKMFLHDELYYSRQNDDVKQPSSINSSISAKPIPIPQSSNSSSPRDDNQDQVKAIILSQLECDFLQIPTLEDESLIDQLKHFLRVLVITDNQITPFWHDHQLQSDLLQCALQRLPSEMVENFKNNRGYRNITLRDLKMFIQDFITEHVTKLNMANHKRYLQETSRTAILVHCYYCKLHGHTFKDCPERLNLICFGCSNYGHVARHCGLDDENEKVRSHIQKEFSNLPKIINENAIGPLKIVINTVTKAAKLIRLQVNDHQLQKLALSYILPKLPQSISKLIIKGEIESLLELKEILGQVIEAHFGEIQQARW